MFSMMSSATSVGYLASQDPLVSGDFHYQKDPDRKEALQKIFSAIRENDRRRKHSSYLATSLIAEMKMMTDEERMDIMSKFSDVFCRWCGWDDPGCQCWNDE